MSLCHNHHSELFVTEASHLRTLRVLDLIFYQRMKKENLMPRDELARLFPNLPELIEIHSKEPVLFQHLPCQPSPFCSHLTHLPGPPWVDNPVTPPGERKVSGQPKTTKVCPKNQMVSRPFHGTFVKGFFLFLFFFSPPQRFWQYSSIPDISLFFPLIPDSLCEAMKRLREEGPIIRGISDLMLSRVRSQLCHLARGD